MCMSLCIYMCLSTMLFYDKPHRHLGFLDLKAFNLFLHGCSQRSFSCRERRCATRRPMVPRWNTNISYTACLSSVCLCLMVILFNIRVRAWCEVFIQKD